MSYPISWLGQCYELLLPGEPTEGEPVTLHDTGLAEQLLRQALQDRFALGALRHLCFFELGCPELLDDQALLGLLAGQLAAGRLRLARLAPVLRSYLPGEQEQAQPAQPPRVPSFTEQVHWLEVRIEDDLEQPLPLLSCDILFASGRQVVGRTDENGILRVEGFSQSESYQISIDTSGIVDDDEGAAATAQGAA